MKTALRFLSQGVLGFALLLLFNLAGSYIGMEAGITLPGVALVGLLGASGFALLLVLQFLAA